MLSVSTPPETCPEENNGHSHNTQTYPHGESYAGECKNGLRHGKGIYYFSDGSWVQGTWENDKLSGNATFYHAQHQRTDQGTFCGTARKGRGMMTWKDGNIYKGTWNDTEEGLQGKGIMLSPEGKKEAGKWINGLWKRRFSYKNSFYDIIYPIQKHPVSSLISFFLIITLLIPGITIDAKSEFSDPYIIFLLTGDLFPSVKNAAYVNMACIISGSALLMLSVCSPVFKRITGIHHNPLTAIFLSSIFIGGSMGFLRTSYQGEFFYTMISIFSLYFLIFMAKCYYQSVRFEFALIAGILFSWLSMLLFRNSYYLFENMCWPYALPLLSVLACFAWGRIKYEQNGFFPAHKSFTLAIAGISINYIILHPWWDTNKILSHWNSIFSSIN